MWVNAATVPRFYPNAITLTVGDRALEEQRTTVEILQKSNLPGRWSVKDSFNTLDLSRRGFDLLFDAQWIRGGMPAAGPDTDIVWQREETATEPWPFDDPGFAMFRGRRDLEVVAGFTLYCSDDLVGVSNVVAETADAAAVWRSLTLLATQTFPRQPLVGYESGHELQAAVEAGFEAGDGLRVWVTVRD